MHFQRETGKARAAMKKSILSPAAARVWCRPTRGARLAARQSPTLPAGIGFRSDPQLQRLGARAERTARGARLRGARRGTGAQQPHPTGRRAGVPDPTRSGVPRGATAASHRGGQTRAAQGRHPGAGAVPRAGSSELPFLVLCHLGGSARDRRLGSQRHPLTRPYLWNGARLRPAFRRGAGHQASARGLRQGGGARRARQATVRGCRSRHLCGRWQLRCPRHVACQQPRRLYHSRLRGTHSRSRLGTGRGPTACSRCRQRRLSRRRGAARRGGGFRSRLPKRLRYDERMARSSLVGHRAARVRTT